MGILTERRVWQREENLRIVGRLSLLEQANVRRAIEHMRIVYRSRAALAKALGMTSDALRKASHPRRRQKKQLVIALAYVAGVRVEQITSGEWPAKDSCPWCGR